MPRVLLVCFRLKAKPFCACHRRYLVDRALDRGVAGRSLDPGQIPRAVPSPGRLRRTRFRNGDEGHAVGVRFWAAVAIDDEEGSVRRRTQARSALMAIGLLFLTLSSGVAARAPRRTGSLATVSQLAEMRSTTEGDHGIAAGEHLAPRHPSVDAAQTDAVPVALCFAALLGERADVTNRLDGPSLLAGTVGANPVVTGQVPALRSDRSLFDFGSVAAASPTDATGDLRTTNGRFLARAARGPFGVRLRALEVGASPALDDDAARAGVKTALRESVAGDDRVSAANGTGKEPPDSEASLRQSPRPDGTGDVPDGAVILEQLWDFHVAVDPESLAVDALTGDQHRFGRQCAPPSAVERPAPSRPSRFAAAEIPRIAITPVVIGPWSRLLTKR
jgi:hypothetical protein